MLCLATLLATGFYAGAPLRQSAVGRTCNVQMLNLFGNSGERPSPMRKQ